MKVNRTYAAVDLRHIDPRQSDRLFGMQTNTNRQDTAQLLLNLRS
jgi:hypothetical protein